MMKSIVFSVVFVLISGGLFGQEKFSIYNPNADAKKELAQAVEQAGKENKHVFIQVGGNWCGWCKFFHQLTTTDQEIKAYMDANFVVYHLNYSKENTNDEVLASLEYPQRFGFPVFVILDQNGRRIHTQNSAYLEEGQGHGKKKVMEFLQAWSPDALNPENYKK